jgi:hypothetical protein
VPLLGEETLAVKRRAYRRFRFGAEAGPKVTDTFLRLAGEIVNCESA